MQTNFQENHIQRSLRIWIVLFFAMSFTRTWNYLELIESDWYSFKHFLKFEIFQMLLATFLSLPLLALRNYYKPYLILLGILMCYFVLEFGHVYIFSGYPNSATFFTIFGTNFQESGSFIADYLSWSLIGWIALYLLLLGIINRVIKTLLQKYLVRFQSAIVMAILSGSVLLFWFAKSTTRLEPITIKDISFVASLESYFIYKKEQQQFEKIANDPYFFDQLTATKDYSQTHLIIIGESTSKHHMSLYGYERETNPLMSKEQLIIFQNAISPNAHTVSSLEKVLTFKTTELSNLGIEDGSILNIANQIGFETFWISNQAFSGDNETPISVTASSAKNKTFINPTGTRLSLDEELIVPLEEALKHQHSHKFIIVHLMGTHLSYKDRYPKKYEYFKDNFNNAGVLWNKVNQDFINQYDNANRYNDYVIHKMLTLLKTRNEPCTFTYFSDHGDEVYDYREFHGHSDVKLSKYMYEIPLLFWCNDAYKILNNEAIDNLEKNLQSNYNIEQLIHFWSDLLGAYTTKLDITKSPFNLEFSSNKNIVDLPVIEVATKNDISFANNIWCHRVNGIKRMREVEDFFGGFEIDITITNDLQFDANHPPAESEQQYLELILGAMKSPKKKGFWLDMKNLSIQNCHESAQRLKNIADQFNITAQTIVESGCLECLQSFDSLGFKTAYYLPPLLNESIENQLKTLKTIELQLKNFAPSVLSIEKGGYAILKKHFPNCDIISWDIHTEWTDEYQKKELINWQSSENRLKILLIRYDSKNWR